jgi:hypothetical protein
MGNPNMVEECGYVDSDGCIYDTEYRISETDYAFNMSADSLFREVLGDIEKEAQAKYNAKITKEQNACIGANNGGLMGTREMSSTYMWVKLNSRRIPKTYSAAGLKVNDFVASNDLYGSFCRARVTIQSDDPNVQAALQKNNSWSTAYFAVGDVFTCGSWIPQSELEKMAKIASGQVEGTEAYERYEKQKEKDNRNANWIAAAAGVAGTVGFGFLADALQSPKALGGLLNKSQNTKSVAKANVNHASQCKSRANNIKSEIGGEGTIDCASGEGPSKCNKINGYAAQLKGQIKAIKDRDGGDGLNVPGSCDKAEGPTWDPSKCLAWAETALAMCEDTINNGGDAEVDAKQDNTRRWISIGAAAAGGLTTGLLVKKAVKDAKESKMTQEQQEAYDKFMREVGDHIRCFIGADEAGTYGDLIEISVE